MDFHGVMGMDMRQDRTQGIVKKLKEKNHRITPQRLAILRTLLEEPGHPSVEDIYRKVRVNFPTTSLATVYKTISVLKEMGEVLELEFSSDHNRYDGHKPYPHPHLICIKCRKVMDPQLRSLSDMTQELVADTGFRILSHRLDFFGLCPECQKGA